MLNVLLAKPDNQLVNQSNQEGQTPLMLAVKHGWWKCVRALVNCKDTDLYIVDQRGQTALDLSGGDFECTQEIEREVNERQREAEAAQASP